MTFVGPPKDDTERRRRYLLDMLMLGIYDSMGGRKDIGPCYYDGKHDLDEYVREVRAQAWDEGRESVGRDFLKPLVNGERSASTNPYRKEDE